MVAGLSAASWSAPSEPTTAVSMTVITSEESQPVRVGRMKRNRSSVLASGVGHERAGRGELLASCASVARLIRAAAARRRRGCGRLGIEAATMGAIALASAAGGWSGSGGSRGVRGGEAAV
eukprot:scaffold19679_cov124-Isochrysis_galbana.AAC.2